MIELQGVTHIFPSQKERQEKALDGVDLLLHPGEYVAVIGPNGSGKSTLAKHLNGLLQPTAGRVRVDGLDTRASETLWSVRQKVGMVFQNPDNQLVAPTVEEEIAFGPENLGLPPAEIRGRLEEALEGVKMTHCRQRPPHLLSGGQKQRVAIAAILAMHPHYLVLDEPTALLDPVGRREVLATVKRLHREKGMAVIHITHNMEEALVAQRVVVMGRGRVILDGTPPEVFSQGATLKQWGLALPPMAELAAELRNQGINLPEGILTAEDLAEALWP